MEQFVNGPSLRSRNCGLLRNARAWIFARRCSECIVAAVLVLSGFCVHAVAECRVFERRRFTVEGSSGMWPSSAPRNGSRGIDITGAGHETAVFDKVVSRLPFGAAHDKGVLLGLFFREP